VVRPNRIIAAPQGKPGNRQKKVIVSIIEGTARLSKGKSSSKQVDRGGKRK
jgi:hypothetical protein